jgi:hypothetical protein
LPPDQRADDNDNDGSLFDRSGFPRVSLLLLGASFTSPRQLFLASAEQGERACTALCKNGGGKKRNKEKRKKKEKKKGKKKKNKRRRRPSAVLLLGHGPKRPYCYGCYGQPRQRVPAHPSSKMFVKMCFLFSFLFLLPALISPLSALKRYASRVI